MLFTPARGFGFDLFDDFFDDIPYYEGRQRSPQGAQKRGAVPMKTDIFDDGTSYLLEMELPGFKKEEIRAELKDGYLTVTAEHAASAEEKNASGKMIRRERYTGSCRRSFCVGDELKQENIRASFENGVLKLRFPKEAPKEEPKAPAYIEIDG